MSVGVLLAQVFAEAKSTHPKLNASWVRISHLVGSRRLPASRLGMSIQRDGEVDLVIRCIEDELRQTRSAGQNDKLFHYCNVMSEYWVGAMYETLRLLRARKLILEDERERFSAIFRDLELLRIPLEKHEIAKEKPLTLTRNPPKNDSSDLYSYDPDDPTHSHIMPFGISARGSVTWHAIDLKTNSDKWIERRALSDQILDLWKEE
jgi:hypothetical protein